MYEVTKIIKLKYKDKNKMDFKVIKLSSHIIPYQFSSPKIAYLLQYEAPP